MVKEPPVTSKGRPRRKTAGKPKAPASPKQPERTGQKKRKNARGKSRNGKKRMPVWLHYMAIGACATIIVIGFYYFFIRPYAYRWKPCYGTKSYGVCLPAGYSVHGFDISHHQGKINWEELRKTQHTPFPIRFVFMKASEGGDFSDTTFIHNFDHARRYGFIRGAYHFFNPNTDATRQADFFIRSVKLEAGDLPPVLDIEKVGNDEKKLRLGVKTWLDAVERHYGVKPILYASYKFKERYLNDSIFDTYPYWIAHYYVDSVRYKGEWKFWQHTDGGTLPGIREQVDLNVFNGTLNELKSLTIPSDTLCRKS